MIQVLIRQCLVAAAAAGLVSSPAAAMGVLVMDHDLQATIAPGVARYLQQLHRSGPNGNAVPDVTMRDVSAENRSACLRLAQDALAAYPDGMVQALVHILALADNIEVWGTLVGGVQGPEVIGVNCAAAERPIVRQVVHGAIAGKVLDLAPPDWTEWAKTNQPGFAYGDPTPFRDALTQPDAALADHTLNAAGFVGRIGLSARQADFQTFAEQIFLDGPGFAATVRANPAMQPKLRLVLRSYLAVAPALDAYFNRTGLANAATGHGQ